MVRGPKVAFNDGLDCTAVTPVDSFSTINIWRDTRIFCEAKLTKLVVL